VVDESLIDELYHASRAGVPVEMLIRGICSVRPGVPGLSETIRIRSVLGRFLEHSRVYWFENAGEPVTFIGSADLMHRNLDRRVEVLVPLPSPELVGQVGEMLDLAFDPHTAAWELASDGSWSPTVSTDGTPQADLQARLIARHRRRRALDRDGSA
jgi:polyphosphate kinase